MAAKKNRPSMQEIIKDPTKIDTKLETLTKPTLGISDPTGAGERFL